MSSYVDSTHDSVREDMNLDLERDIDHEPPEEDHTIDGDTVFIRIGPHGWRLREFFTDEYIESVTGLPLSRLPYVY